MVTPVSRTSTASRFAISQVGARGLGHGSGQVGNDRQKSSPARAEQLLVAAPQSEHCTFECPNVHRAKTSACSQPTGAPWVHGPMGEYQHDSVFKGWTRHQPPALAARRQLYR